MEIKKELIDDTLTLALSGRLDAVTAMELDKELQTLLNGVKNLVFDFAEVEYVASAGLRIMLKTQKRMDKQGSMEIKNVSENVREVFDMTGFSNFLNIEEVKKKKLSISF